jgi:hypothetical protein
MSGKKTLIALSAALALGILGAASAAQASDHENQSGGFKIGPLGQLMGTPAEWGASGAPRGAYAYGFVSPTHEPLRTKSRRHD